VWWTGRCGAAWYRPLSRILAEPECWEAVLSADAERTGVRYQDVLDSLRVSYDCRAAWRDQQEKQPWKLAERELFLGRLHFQSLTMRRPA
jgi:hypothetical protein